MDNDELVTYVSHLIDAYTSVSKRIDTIEHKIEMLSSERNYSPKRARKVYMEIHGTANGKNI